MKRVYIILFLLMPVCFWAQHAEIGVEVSPSHFEQTDSITLTIEVNEGDFKVQDSHELFLWAWFIDQNGESHDAPTNTEDFNTPNEAPLDLVSSEEGHGTYTFTMSSVEGFYGQTQPIKEIGFLIKNADGSRQSKDIILAVGRYQFQLESPEEGSRVYMDSGSNLKILGEASIPSIFEIEENDHTIYTSTAASIDLDYTYNITQDAEIVVKAMSKESEDAIAKSFTVKLREEGDTAPIPDYIRPGISYNLEDPSKVGLALYAPEKDFVYVVGSFNDWQEKEEYLMKRDREDKDLFWLEIDDLSPQEIYTFQYSVNGEIRVADPYSPLVLAPNDAAKVNSTTYPDLPEYPVGQSSDVSVIQTGQPEYEWEVTDFNGPEKSDLIVYELLLRDFTKESNWESLIEKLPYLEELGINAIEIMPLMEFDATTSWGYDTAFHYALDKSYGTADSFKKFVDESHKKGIAVILDIALNHATDRNPLVKMWKEDPHGTGFGPPAADNPYFNQEAKHAFGVFNDFNHSRPETHYYVKRVLEQWIKDFHVDGFRWDLTKGFTQSCTEGDEACTNAYQQDRVDIMKRYADYQWSFDGDSYVIFEHLGEDREEQEWANYRLDEGKGVLLWNKMTDPYNQNTMSYKDDSNFDRVDFRTHGFEAPRAMNYGESHDEERLMFKNLIYGNSNGDYSANELANALDRQKAYGAVFLPLPGPKMILQFAELGYDLSIYTCSDGNVDLDSGDCRLQEKPSAFALHYDTDEESRAVYDTWAQLLALRLQNEVFDTPDFEVQSGDLKPRIYIHNADTEEALNEVIIMANFTLQKQEMQPEFTEEGTWFDLMDYSKIEVEDVDMSLNLNPGGFKILGNALPKGIEEEDDDDFLEDQNELDFRLVQNPVTQGVAQFSYVHATEGIISIYNLGGKMVKQMKLETGEGITEIPVDNLSEGIYFVRLDSNRGVVKTKMIIGK